MKITHIVILLIALSLPQFAVAKEKLRAISVKGSSVIIVEPDHSKIHAQLKIVSRSVEESYQQVTLKLAGIADDLQKLGLAKDDFIVSVISQGADYEWRNNARVLNGYYSACSILIKVNTIEDTYKIHSELSKMQDLAVGHTEYGRSDHSQLETKVLQKALQNASAKAKAMAETLGATLGPVLHIQEAGVPTVIGRTESFRLAKSADVAEVVTTGSVSVQGDVVVEFELQ